MKNSNQTTLPTHLATVVFVLFGTSTVATFVLSAFFERMRLSGENLACLVIALCALALIYRERFLSETGFGGALTMIGRVGYGSFFILSKRSEIGSGLLPLWYLYD